MRVEEFITFTDSLINSLCPDLTEETCLSSYSYELDSPYFLPVTTNGRASESLRLVGLGEAGSSPTSSLRLR